MIKTEKNIVKYYLKIKDNLNEKEKYFKYLQKIFILINQIDDNYNFEFLSKKYFDSIRNFSHTLMENIINESLTIKNSRVSDNIFELINEGNISSISEVENNDYKIFNDEGLTPLHKCINLGDTSILKQFLKKGEKIDIVNKNGNTLLEYACLQRDPNLISFISNHGGDMKKHLFFREKFKLKLKVNDIDTAILLKICLSKGNSESNNLSFLNNYIDEDYEIGLADIKFKVFIKFLEGVVDNLDNESRDNLIEIWKEELSYSLKSNLGCPDNYLELVLINLVPFIDYPFNISNRNVITNELIFSIKNIFVKNNSVNNEEFNINLINFIWKEYEDILPLDYIGIIINNILTNIKINL